MCSPVQLAKLLLVLTGRASGWNTVGRDLSKSSHFGAQYCLNLHGLPLSQTCLTNPFCKGTAVKKRRVIKPKPAYVDRRERTQLTADYEDGGLFKADILQVEVQLTPAMYRNSRHDLIVRAYNAAGQSFEIIFAGRRSVMAAPLIANLEALKASFERQPKGKRLGQVDIDALRVPITVEGAWRRRFWTDDNGWQSRENQLVAARWSVMGPAEKVVTFGVSPGHLTRPASPVVGDGGPGEGGHVQQAARGN